MDVPSESAWRRAANEMMTTQATTSNTTRFNDQLYHTSKVFVVSLHKSLCHKGMFDELDCVTDYEFKGKRIWGDKGGLCYDIRMTFVKPVQGLKVKKMVECFVRAKVPPKLKEKVHAVVKSPEYLKQQEAGATFRSNEKPPTKKPQTGDKPVGCPYPQCPKCVNYFEFGQARGSHAPSCPLANVKPPTKKTKEYKAYLEAQEQLMGDP